MLRENSARKLANTQKYATKERKEKYGHTKERLHNNSYARRNSIKEPRIRYTEKTASDMETKFPAKTTPYKIE